MQPTKQNVNLALKSLVATITFLVIALSGCAKKVHQDAQPMDNGVQSADTAAVEGGAPVEGAAPVDATPPPADAPVEMAQPAPDAQPPMNQEAQPQTNAAPEMNGEVANYSVQKGDTLMKIAFNVYGDILKWKDLYELNKDMLKDANVLEVGASLKYAKPAAEANLEKNGDPYMIKQGDTLGTIADDIYAKKEYWKKLYENNRTLIKDPNKIYAGFYLYYQITEQEKQEAADIKAKRGGAEAQPVMQQPIGHSDQKQPAPQPTDFTKVQSPHTSSGLTNLLRQSGNGTRTPANSK